MKKSYPSLSLRFHPDKNQHSQFTEVMKMINEAKEELESTLRHYDEIREEEIVRIAQTIIISSESSSSDHSLETSSFESSGSEGMLVQV